MYNDSKISWIYILSLNQYNHKIIIKIYYEIIIKIINSIKTNKK